MGGKPPTNGTKFSPNNLSELIYPNFPGVHARIKGHWKFDGINFSNKCFIHGYKDRGDTLLTKTKACNL